MKTSDACLFLAVGFLMWVAPLVAPGHFPQEGPGQINPSALWLQFMGWVNGGLGIIFIVCERMALVIRRLAAVTRFRPAACAELLRPPLPGEVKASLSSPSGRHHLAA
ncbi:MAG TPA: hypothetical protein VHD32_07050 [Candidatus Didemnitutus sp.]|nr:hypothetical protein [Candidatus Didemnitutus sp.]